jgi:hypothetical protein
MILNKTQLKQILLDCASYVESTDQESIDLYFEEIINSNLFADAVGKVVNRTDNGIEIVTEY